MAWFASKAHSWVITCIFDKTLAERQCVKNWEFRRHSHCNYTVAHCKTIECGRMTMAPHSSHIYPCLAFFPEERFLQGCDKGRKTFGFPTNVCPSRRRVTTATGESTGCATAVRRAKRGCEEILISEPSTGNAVAVVKQLLPAEVSKTPEPKTAHAGQRPRAHVRDPDPEPIQIARTVVETTLKRSDQQFD